MKKIALLDLGGTISSCALQNTSEFYNQPGYSINSFVNDFDFSEEIAITYMYFCNKISHELNATDLLSLGNRIQDIVDTPDIFGVVVSMGTNALEDVAYFIGLVVNTRKNIVFTGSHFPQNSLAFDGKKNLFNALVVAKSDANPGMGVVITFNDTVVSSRWATKSKPGIPNDFSFDGFGILGYVVGGNFHQKMLPLYRHTFNSEFAIRTITALPEVIIFYAHISANCDYINYVIDNEKCDGIVSAGYGKGYQTKEISNLLSKAASRGIKVVRCARTGQSVTNIDGQYDDRYGFIVAPFFSPHKASLLLSVCLSKELTNTDVQNIFKEY
ncbi:asparaginase domain-containing protein [Legionella sp. CNM-4043-24]|uniref:asparaginase domain-containing protein n=1 Tax=Legionella sp. CNM-4043-24 TaxID=3421646 RepID=UPI00403AAC46